MTLKTLYKVARLLQTIFSPVISSLSDHRIDELLELGETNF